MVEEQTLGPLTGVRVIELASVEGQYCGKLLGDMGADVLLIEPPEGSPARRIGPFAEDRPGLNRSLNFWYYNTSKRGLTLDISRPAGQEMLRRLLAGADVVLESFRPGHLATLGLEYEALEERKPGLILASITPFGQTGPWRGFKSCDLVNMALGGPMASNGYDDLAGSPPIRPDGGHSYLMGSEFGFIAILLALIEREVSGQGQWLDVAIHEACAGTTEGAFPNWEYSHQIVKRQTGRHASPGSTRPWQHRTADGRFVNLMGGGIPRSFGSWKPLMAWMGRHGAAGDLSEPRYETILHRSPAQRRDATTLHVLDTIAHFVQGISAEEVYREGQARKLPWAVIRSPEENLDDPHWHDRGFFVEVEQPEIGGSATYPGAPYRFSRTPWSASGPRHAPLLGEHNVQIYQGELGLTREELRALFEQGVM